MEAIIIASVSFIGLALLGLFAQTAGVDSRDTMPDDHRR
jgi:hypothetical protein